MTKLKIFFIGLSALIILSFFGYKYWQTQPSYSLLQIQESIESKKAAFENKEFYLYDTFEGLDLRYSTTMEMALSLDAEGIAEYSKNDNETGVRNRFEKFKWVKVVKGVVPDILKISSPKKISFLHLDLNAGEAETKALDYLYDRVTNGGVILIDDYGRFEHNQLHCAHNQWFLNKGQSILELPTGQGLVIKRD